MTPEQRIKLHILKEAIADEVVSIDEEITEENIDELFDASNEEYELQDFINGFRCSGEETNIPAPSSRHYESYSVAQQLSDGSWVGWIYWYGGGKHGEPEAIDWMDEAYDLKVTEEEKLVVVRTFEKA